MEKVETYMIDYMDIDEIVNHYNGLSFLKDIYWSSDYYFCEHCERFDNSYLGTKDHIYCMNCYASLSWEDFYWSDEECYINYGISMLYEELLENFLHKKFPLKINCQTFDEDFICQCCKRSAKECIRLTENGDKFYISIHNHHCHGKQNGYPQRFEESRICADCNQVEGMVKRELKLPKWFSFSPIEINQFIYIENHKFHEIKYKQAKIIYQKAKENHDYRHGK